MMPGHNVIMLRSLCGRIGGGDDTSTGYASSTVSCMTVASSTDSLLTQHRRGISRVISFWHP